MSSHSPESWTRGSVPSLRRNSEISWKPRRWRTCSQINLGPIGGASDLGDGLEDQGQVADRNLLGQQEAQHRVQHVERHLVGHQVRRAGGGFPRPGGIRQGDESVELPLQGLERQQPVEVALQHLQKMRGQTSDGVTIVRPFNAASSRMAGSIQRAGAP
jgi:hypothetical protein